MLVVERLMVAELVPVPVRATVCGLLPALSEMFRVAVRVPVPVGVKVMPMVQESPAGTLDPQSFDCPKSERFVPLPKILLMVKAVLRVLVSVTFCVALVVPTACEPNVRLVGDTVTVPHDGRVNVEMRVCQIGFPVPV